MLILLLFLATSLACCTCYEDPKSFPTTFGFFATFFHSSIVAGFYFLHTLVGRNIPSHLTLPQVLDTLDSPLFTSHPSYYSGLSLYLSVGLFAAILLVANYYCYTSMGLRFLMCDCCCSSEEACTCSSWSLFVKRTVGYPSKSLTWTFDRPYLRKYGICVGINSLVFAISLLFRYWMFPAPSYEPYSVLKDMLDKAPRASPLG